MSQAGFYLDARARCAKAESLFRRALAITRQALGPAHPRTAENLNNLAGLYYAQRKPCEAEPLLAQALGPEHPATVTVRKNLEGLREQRRRAQESSRARRPPGARPTRWCVGRRRS